MTPQTPRPSAEEIDLIKRILKYPAVKQAWGDAYWALLRLLDSYRLDRQRLGRIEQWAKPLQASEIDDGDQFEVGREEAKRRVRALLADTEET